MLEHEPSPSQTPASSFTDAPQKTTPLASAPPEAVNARVTAEEFTAAVAAVEARRAAAAKREGSTVPIGQAVDELGVNIPPADIWAEVQARRQQGKPVPLAQSAAIKAAALLKWMQAGASPLLAKSVADWQSQFTDYKSEAFSIKQMEAELHARKRGLQKRRGPVVALIIAACVIGATAFGGHDGSRDRDNDAPSISSVSSSSQTRTLAEVKDGDPVSVTQDVLEKIEKGQDMAQTLVQGHGDVDNGWTLVKHNGHVYVRAFTKPLSDSALQVGEVKLYNDNDVGELDGNPDQEVTLRLDTLKIDKTDASDGWREMDVSHVHPDAFAREAE